MKPTTPFAAMTLLLCAPSLADPPFIVSSNGHEVIDTTTQLIWRRCAEGMTWNGRACEGTLSLYSVSGAIAHARAQSAASGVVWRVPSLKELLSVNDPTRLLISSIDATALPNMPPKRFWTSTPFALYTPPEANGPRHMQYVDFSVGGYMYAPVEAAYALKLVRDAR
jgi:Protein of unknown function (DUF1566)